MAPVARQLNARCNHLAPPEEHSIDADLLRVPVGPGSLHVERYGHGGHAVLLIHGFGTCSFVWRNVGPSIALANLTAFAVDLFGYGESDRPFDADYGIAAQAEYLDRGLTALRVARATVVGLDLGGAVALRFAAAHPDRVEKLVLVNPIALDEIPADDVKSLQKNTGKYALRVSRGIMGAAPLLRELLTRSVSDPAKMPEPLVARYMAPYVGREGVDHLLRIARFVDKSDMEEIDLRALPQPTLVIWGERDPWVSAKVGDQLATTIGGSRLVRLPATGRLVPEESPEMLSNLLLDFIGARGAGGTV
jgi:pimeloyl-ACP methyl ester carboxylesterase